MAKRKVEEVAVEEVKPTEPEVISEEKPEDPFVNIWNLRLQREKLIEKINKLFNKEEK